jgi:hypothetical protein
MTMFIFVQQECLVNENHKVCSAKWFETQEQTEKQICSFTVLIAETAPNFPYFFHVSVQWYHIL